MRHDEPEPLPPWTGPYVVIRPEGLTWTVSIEPIPETGVGAPRTYSCKNQAFAAAQELWTAGRLPCRDLTVGGTARAHDGKIFDD